MSRASAAVPRIHLLALAAITASILAACSSDKIVYRDRQPFNQPPVAAAGFLGYYDTVTKLTTCGNCHVDYQAKWSQTLHAKGVATLKAQTSATAVCYGCHTVNGRGNAQVGSKVGYDTVKVATYNDIQCESCHGAGLQHVEGVGQGTLVRPLAKISMAGTGNCGDCHSGAHHPFVEEWKQSEHAVVPTGSHATSATCNGCHEGRAFLARMGVTANFQEKADANAAQAITCATCHDPHGSPNTAQLRRPINTLNPDQNLCMQCHNRRTAPDGSSTSPHAPQGAVLLGYAGYRPPGFEYDSARIYGSHATDKNPNLCAGCHIAKFTVNDKLTGAFSFQATGHLMRPVPCLDAAGKPTADKTCAYTATARSWQTCTASGCHGTAAVAANAFNTVRARMKFLADQLWLNLDNDGTLDASPTDGGILATLKLTKPGEWASNTVVSPAEGAEFNARICGEYNQSNADNSKGIHNPFLCDALLVSTINYLRSYYGLPAASASIQVEIDTPLTTTLKSPVNVSRSQPR